VTESSDQAIARTIIDNTASQDQQILVLNAMQSVSRDDVESGITYLSIMRDNLEVLEAALK
jgi:zinc transport system substrate-binding protein